MCLLQNQKIICFYFLLACSDGMMVEDNCYFLLAKEFYNFEDALKLCGSVKSHLAQINDQKLLMRMKGHITEKLIKQYGFHWPTDTGDYVSVWLGAEMDTPQTKMVRI